LTGYVIEHNGGWFSILPDTAGKGNALRHYAETRGSRPIECSPSAIISMT
jgi:hypothetical protein